MPCSPQITAISVGAHKLKGIQGEQVLLEIKVSATGWEQ
jgi:hypothetical protein